MIINNIVSYNLKDKDKNRLKIIFPKVLEIEIEMN